MRVLIYGHKGWIGEQFLHFLNTDPDIQVFIPVSRVDDMVEVERELDETKPTHVVSFIGRTHGEINRQKYPTIDYLEQPGKLQENLRDNL